MDPDIQGGVDQERAEWIGRMKDTVIEARCAWCNISMGTKDGGGTVGVSHGICEGCANDMLCEEPN